MVYTGTSGYSFREWVGSFYPPKTPSKRYLAYYASRLKSVEINHTFRRFPNAERIGAWAEETPETFKFSLKMHQSVTHLARLKNVGDSVTDFVKALEPLGPRLGVVLCQLPPYFRFDLERLETFLEELPAGPRYAMEFRHDSWNEPVVLDRLRDSGVALCAAEADIGAGQFVCTASFAYLRLRKVPPYTDEEMGTLRRQLTDVASRVEDVYLYLKHDDEGLAPRVASEIQIQEG